MADPKPARGRANRSLRTTLLQMIVAAMGPLILLGAAANWYQWRSERDEIDRRLANTASIMALAMDGEVQRAEAMLAALAASDAIDRKDWRSLHRQATEATRNEPDTFIALTEPSGVQPVRTMLPYGAPPVNPLAIARQHTQAEWRGRKIPLSTQGLAGRVFKTGELATSGLYFGITTQKPSVAIAAPVIRDGKTAYVLIKVFTADKLVKLLQDADQPEVRISLIDAAGLIIARNQDPEGAIGRKVNEPIQTFAEDRIVTEGRNAEGEMRVNAYKRLAHADWIVRVAMSRSTALAGAWRSVLTSTALGIALLLLAILGARRFWLRVAPAISMLGQSARAIQRGEAVSLPESRIKEIDELASLVREAAQAEERERSEAMRRQIAEEKTAETRRLLDALKDSETRFRLLFEHSGTGMGVIDANTGQFVLVNERLCEITGYSAEELMQHTFAEITHPEDAARDAIAVAELLQERRSQYDVEKRYVRKDGTLRWVQLHVRRFPSPDPERPMTFASINDITERKQAEIGLQESNRRKDEFLATLAHELRNPLAPIRSGVAIVKRHPDEQTLERTAAMMERQLSHMVRLIDDLLDVSRISIGRLELKKEPVDLARLVDFAVESIQPTIAQRGHVLDVKIEDAPLIVDGDRARLAQIIGNLLVNAAKFMTTPGVVSLNLKRVQDRVLISVRDRGIGIPRDKLEAVFELFSQIQPVSARGTDAGLGIGLHLVKRLVMLHGGTVVARSDGPGTGSEFVIEIPLAVTAMEQRAALAGGAADSQAVKVLVVDDNRDAADSLATVLQLLGHSVNACYDGASAVSLAQSSSPDLLLLDLGMPGMDGFEVCRALRGLQNGHRIRIVALSGWGQENDRNNAREAGFDGHLIKPVDIAEVERLIAELQLESAPLEPTP